MANFNLSTIVPELEDFVDVVARRFTLGTFVRTQKKAPVDEGRFRSSIIVSLNTPNASQATRANPSPLGGIDPTALSAATSIINGFSITKDRSLHIQSNLPYAERIENGFSGQAPAGVFKASVREELEAFNSYGDN